MHETEEQDHRDETSAWVWRRKAAGTDTVITVWRRSQDRLRRWVKRGNLYPEQHQIGVRDSLGCRRVVPSEYAGRWLDHASNGLTRGMIACRGDPVYRIRPIDLLCLLDSLPAMTGLLHLKR